VEITVSNGKELINTQLPHLSAVASGIQEAVTLGSFEENCIIGCYPRLISFHPQIINSVSATVSNREKEVNLVISEQIHALHVHKYND